MITDKNFVTTGILHDSCMQIYYVCTKQLLEFACLEFEFENFGI